MKICRFLSVMLLLPCLAAQAGETLKLQPVADNVYAIVGELGNRSPDNLGNNATSGFVVTDEGVLLVDPGGSYLGAQRIQEQIRAVTDKPVKIVINTGGQDHRWMGNGFFKAQGAKIIASQAADADHKARARDQLSMLLTLVGEAGMAQTEPVYADETFEKALHFSFGGMDIELYHLGAAHTPGDVFVRLPQSDVIFTGDIVYVERMLGIMGESSSKNWLTVFEAMAAHKPKHVVPGHGSPTDLSKAEADTYGYLVFLRQAVRDFMDNGGDISDIRNIDQSKYAYLENYDTLAGRNAQRVYSELEWE